MGGMNYHVEIQFRHGASWLARIRTFNATSPPPIFRDYLVRGEGATFQFFANTAVPAPKILDCAFEGEDNPVGVSYTLMDKMPGTSLRWSLPSRQKKIKVMSQIADIYRELHAYQFTSMGSMELPGIPQYWGFARDSLVDFTGPEMLLFGPCSSLERFFTASVHLILDLIMRVESCSQHANDGYLIHRLLLDSIPAVLSTSIPHDEIFYLKHADDKGDHILVDYEYKITGIIDWEWAYITSKNIAFNSPIMLFDVGDFNTGE